MANPARKADTEASNWLDQIEQAEKRREVYNRKVDKIVQRYRDEREDSEGSGKPRKRMNMLWSNVQTLMPCIYSRAPVPIAERRFLDHDVKGRVGSQILERGMRYEMQDCGFDDALQQSVLDYCLGAQAVVWWRYVPLIGHASSPAAHGEDQINSDIEEEETDGISEEQRLDNESDESTEEAKDQADGKLLGASVDLVYINRRDFNTSKARTWKEVEWVSRTIYMGRDDLIERFGEEKGKEIPLEMSPGDDGDKTSAASKSRIPDEFKKAVVYEIWYKPTRTVYFVAKGYDELCDKVDDPLNLNGFWPCPRPLFGTMTNETIIPVPDFIEYQDQANEIDNLTQRMDQLTHALKVAGVYDGSVKELARLLDEGMENKLIPVPQWAAFAGKGGLTAAISFLPIKEVADVLSSLSEARDKAKQDLYEITGLSDIIRGQSDPRETAEAQKTKGRWGSLRLQQRQKAVARFCRDIICMMGEILSEHYPTDTLINVSGAMYDDGIGPEMPIKPTKPMPQVPPLVPPQPHPMLLPPVGASAMPPRPGMLPPPQGMPMPGQGQPMPQAAMGIHPGMPMPPSPPQMGAPHPPMPPQAGGPPGAPPGPPQAPPAPPPDPMMVYAQALRQYSSDLQHVLGEKHQIIMGAIDLLRQDKLRGFRIDIETDSTISDDASDERADRTAFLTAATGFLKMAQEMGAQNPDAVPLLGKMLQFGIRSFRVGRDLESSFDTFIDNSEKKAKQLEANPPPPPPNPELIKAQAQAKADEAKAQAEIESQKIEAASEQQNSQMRMQEKQLDFQMKQAQFTQDQKRMELQAQYDAADHAQKMQELQMKAAIANAEHERKLAAMRFEDARPEGAMQ